MASGNTQSFATVPDALRFLDSAACKDIEAPPDAPPFKGGWVGYFSYDLGRAFEALPALARDDLHLPLAVFCYHPFVFAIDHQTNRHFAIQDESVEPAQLLPSPRASPLRRFDATSTFTRPAYLAAVRRVLDYIAAGDVYQVNLSQRLSVGVEGRYPAEIYERLQRHSPSQFGALLDYGDWALISNSPELFVRIEQAPTGCRRIITRPIKGTRPRAPGMASELRDSIKDQAELAMIVDLERNDLGRVCRVGSVRVSQPREIEEHPTVYHGAATVEGLLRDDARLIDILGAMFPGGSVTGAPKIRAMQIIEELEPVRRGPYCGAIGFISADGTVQFNLAIRTIIIRNGVAHVPVGGGIVADSTPAEEYDETLVKSRAMLGALGIEAPTP